MTTTTNGTAYLTDDTRLAWRRGGRRRRLGTTDRITRSTAAVPARSYRHNTDGQQQNQGQADDRRSAALNWRPGDRRQIHGHHDVPRAGRLSRAGGRRGSRP
jgi:hypothetical protein